MFFSQQSSALFNRASSFARLLPHGLVRRPTLKPARPLSRGTVPSPRGHCLPFPRSLDAHRSPPRFGWHWLSSPFSGNPSSIHPLPHPLNFPSVSPLSLPPTTMLLTLCTLILLRLPCRTSDLPTPARTKQSPSQSQSPSRLQPAQWTSPVNASCH